jgi:hypothetical protein
VIERTHIVRVKGTGAMVYSTAAIFASEAIATCVAIYLGEAIIANELLCKTKVNARQLLAPSAAWPFPPPGVPCRPAARRHPPTALGSVRRAGRWAGASWR